MKACKFCGTQVEDTAQRCPSCGSNVFLHICENCGNQFDSGFCPNCGVKAGAKKKTCPDCHTVYFSNACPNCGYTPHRKPVVQEVVHKHVYVEPEPKPQPTPTQARQTKKKGKGCGCLTWIIIILVIAGLFGNRSTSKKTTTSTTRTTSVKTTSSVTRDPNATAVPTATPEPAVAAAQAKVDAYFDQADETEVTAIKESLSALQKYEMQRTGKVITVERSWTTDRGQLTSTKHSH